MGAVVLVATAACSSSSGSASGDHQIVVAVPGEPPNLDPCNADVTNVSVILNANVAEALTKRNPAGGVVPVLATKWSQLSPTEWSFAMRDGVKFSDGTALTAGAAADSINRTFNAHLGCSVPASFFSSETVSAKAKDDHTLLLTTSASDPILPLKMTQVLIQKSSGSEHAFVNTPIGSGPYKVDRWDHGSDVILTVNKDYWGATPKVTGAKYVFRSEDQVRADQVSTGEADLALGLGPAFGDKKGATTFPLSAVDFLRMDARGPLFSNPLVRQAVNLAIDRQGLIKTTYNGGATPANQVFAKDVDGYNPDIPTPAFDASKAKTLIQQARAQGAPTSDKVTIYERDDLFSESSLLSQAVAQELNDIGLNVTVQSMDAAAWLQIYSSGNKSDRNGMLMTESNNALGDGAAQLDQWFGSKSVASSVPDKFASQGDSLIQQASKATGDQRTTLLRQANAYLTKTDTMAFIAYPQSVILEGPKVSYKPSVLSQNIVALAEVHLK